MSLILLIPIIIMIVGLVIFVLATNAKVSELGKWMFVVGLFFTVAYFARHLVKIP